MRFTEIQLENHNTKRCRMRHKLTTPNTKCSTKVRYVFEPSELVNFFFALICAWKMYLNSRATRDHSAQHCEPNFAIAS